MTTESGSGNGQVDYNTTPRPEECVLPDILQRLKMRVVTAATIATAAAVGPCDEAPLVLTLAATGQTAAFVTNEGNAEDAGDAVGTTVSTSASGTSVDASSSVDVAAMRVSASTTTSVEDLRITCDSDEVGTMGAEIAFPS